MSFIKNVFVLLAVLLLNSTSLVGHASAMTSMQHEMHSPNHSEHSKDNSPASCATLCRTAVVERETIVLRDSENKDDDEPAIPFYTQKQGGYFSDTLVSQKLYADSVKPPPKIPIYILYAVFRV